MHDIVIRGGSIVDGSGAERYTGDVAIDGGRIAQVGGKAGPGTLTPASQLGRTSAHWGGELWRRRCRQGTSVRWRAIAPQHAWPQCV